MTTHRPQIHRRNLPFFIALAQFRLPAIPWQSLNFALRTTAASLIALYIAFLLDLDDPKWAAMTVWIVAQGSRGMSLSKSQYRLAGTVVGAIVAIVLIAVFAQAPTLFVITLALWLALCTAVATGLRNFKAYGAVLAGYTAAIIAMDAAATPDQVFDIAVSRVLYIGLGIVIEAIGTAIFAPGNPLPDIKGRLSTYTRQAATVSAQALSGQPDMAGLRMLLPQALDIEVAAEYAAAASPEVRAGLSHLRAAIAATLAQLVAAQSLSRQMDGAGAEPDALVSRAASLMRDMAAGQAEAPTMVAQLTAEIDAALGGETQNAGLPATGRHLALDRLDTLLTAARQASRHSQLFAKPRGAGKASTTFHYHVDHVAALHNAIRSFVAILAASAFWIATAWSSGPAFVVLTGVMCALFATRPNPIAGGLGFLRGGLLAVIAAAICDFAILPAMHDFTTLALLLGAILAVTGLAMRKPAMAGPATAFAFLFLDLVNPDNATRVDAATFFNGAVAMILGIACGVIVFALVFPANPRAARARLHRALLTDLQRVGHGKAFASPERWSSAIADRIGHHLRLSRDLSSEDAAAELRGLLAALTIGDGAIALAELAKAHPQLKRETSVVLRRIGRGDPARLSRSADAASRRLLQHRTAPIDRPRLRAAALAADIGRMAAAEAAFLKERS